MRALIDFPDDQIAALAELSRREKKSRAALVRQAVSKLLADASEAERLRAIDAAFGCWKGNTEDGLTMQRRLRAEWDDRDRRIDEQLGRTD